MTKVVRRTSQLILKHVFYPGILLLALGVMLGEFLSLFFFPEWSPKISAFLLGLSSLAIGRLLWKTARLIIAETRKKMREGLYTLPPLHFLKHTERRKSTMSPMRKFTYVFLMLTALITLTSGAFMVGSIDAEKRDPLSIQSEANSIFSLLRQQEKTSCTPSQSPLQQVANDIPNASVEEINSSGQPTSWQTQVIGTNDAKFSFSTNGDQSKHALTVTSKNLQQGSAMWLYQPQPARARQTYRYSDWYQATSPTILMVMYVTGGTPHYQIIDQNIPVSGRWAHYSMAFDIPDQAGKSPVVSVIHALNTAGTLTIANMSLHPDISAFARPLISITFDDGWASQITNGLPLLCKYQIPGTFYIVSGYLDYASYMNPNQINTLIRNGQEIASHTVDHEDLDQIPHDRIHWEITACQQTLQKLFHQKIDDFAAPYDSTNDDAIQQIRGLYQSQRDTDPKVDDSVLNGPRDFDPYHIQSVTITNTTKLKDIQHLIDQAIKTRTWLVLVFHQMDTSNLEYSTTPTYLEEVFKYINSHPSIKPVTMEQAIAEIYQQI